MVVSSGSAATSDSAGLKLDQLREFFSKSPTGAKRNGDESASVAASMQFAEALFSRAPSDFIEDSTLQTLAEIATEARAFYEQYIASGRDFAVEVRNAERTSDKKRFTAILTGMADRPFIVDTLSELLRVRHIRHHVMLHPILRHADTRLTSLTYFEIDPLEDQTAAEELKAEIQSRLSELLVISNDFKAMVGEIDKVAAELLQASTNGPTSESDRLEISHFLRWLADGGFVFLGFKQWSAQASPKQLSVITGSELGVFRSKSGRVSAELLDVESNLQFQLEQPGIFRHAKLVAESPVHRYGRMEMISLKLPSEKKGEFRLLAFVGLLTSKAIAQETSTVPIIRLKLKKILELEGLVPNSHDYKEIISIVDSMPKTELLQYPVEVLRRDISMVYSIQGRSQLKTRYFLDPLKHLISILIAIPRERYWPGARTRIMMAMEALFHSHNASGEFHTTTTDYPLYVLHILLPNPGRSDLPVTAGEIEKTVLDIVLTWEDKLANAAGEAGGLSDPKVVPHYTRVLPDSYKATVGVGEALKDIRILDALTPDASLEVSIEPATPLITDVYDLKLYKQGADLTISAILPFLENCGFSIVHETVTPLVSRSGLGAAIYKLRVKAKSGRVVELERAREILLPGLKLVLTGKADNDRLNELMLYAGLNYRQVAILRVLTHYLWQIKATTSDQAVGTAIIENPAVAAKLVEFFTAKFDPAAFSDMEHRTAHLDAIREEFLGELKHVSLLIHDRTLRRLLNVIEATVRTNYFRIGDDTRIALKIDCKKIERMPTPRPHFEIFVNAPDFEGVHLRGGKVARGGLRWSDREDDFRTEVLGLMKTQMVKNSIIIPVGAKGGFVLKHRPTNPAELPEAVKQTYIRFVRSMLEITDNRSGGSVVHPPDCVVYDGEDPYFVVAADRGTATFSDVANSLAVSEFQFWLGDAFASGGSNGYDHKKLAITSRGVWEAVCRHFREIGIDPEQQEFSVVGIGDMSGDVFGNGLLRSRKAKLLGAFDHRHIFIDPSPDPAASFEERLRLFNLPASKWSDYNAQLISKGGGIYPRAQKEIHISPEAQQALGIQQQMLSGHELIRAILRAPVDLLWNGGIGTYVKSAEEDDLAVGDRTNDDVRIDARDLRVKVVGEGGNLGFTQRARIEYSKIGGHINTDAVDNSGGVNLSDLEVNFKILLSAPADRGELSSEERSKVLMSFADEMCLKVVSRNRSQSRAISMGVIRSRKNLSYVKSLMANLEHLEILDRKAEHMPDDDTLKHRIQLKAGLTRPELAVLIGYTKMWLWDVLEESTLVDDPFLRSALFGYFPKGVVERFGADIERHPLRREIIATEVANAAVERMGTTFITRSAEDTGNTPVAVMKAYLAADAIIGGNELTRQLEVLDRPNSTRQHLLALARLTSSLDAMTRWLLDHRHEDQTVDDLVSRYHDSFRLLVKETDTLTTQLERARFREACKQLIVNGVPGELAHSVASLSYSSVYLDVIEVSNTTGAPVLEVAKLVSHLYLALLVRPLLEQISELEAADRWEESALRTLTVDLRRAMAKLATSIIHQKNSSSLEAMESYLESRREIVNRFQSTYKELSGRPLTVPALLIMTNQLFALSRL